MLVVTHASTVLTSLTLYYQLQQYEFPNVSHINNRLRMGLVLINVRISSLPMAT